MFVPFWNVEWWCYRLCSTGLRECALGDGAEMGSWWCGLPEKACGGAEEAHGGFGGLPISLFLRGVSGGEAPWEVLLYRKLVLRHEHKLVMV